MHLLYSFYLRLQPLGPAQVSPSQGHHAHAVVFSLIRRSSPSLAQALHDTPGVKPFTVSPLFGRFLGRAPAPLTLLPDETYSLRVTALREEVFAAVLDGAIRHASEPVRLEQAAFSLHQVQTVPTTAPLVRCQSYEELLDCAQPQATLHLEFITPSTFRTKEERNVLQPEPRLLVQSWLAKWNAFSPIPLDPGLAEAACALRPAYLNVRVRSMHLGNHPELGFCGRAGYVLPDGAPRHIAHALTALADFSLYCGSGAKTTMGMGQSRRLANGHPLSGRTGCRAEERR